jgi:hypothetical protein
MIDIETLGTRSNAAILSIGAVKFNIISEFVEDCGENAFHAHINPDSCFEKGLTYDQPTLDWWKEQDKKAQDKIAKECINGLDIKYVLQKFSEWLSKNNLDNTQVWGNGSSFDISILESAFRACNLSIPWKYYNIRDVRTIAWLAMKRKDLDKIERHKATLEHDALSDAIAQCKDVQNYYKILGL